MSQEVKSKLTQHISSNVTRGCIALVLAGGRGDRLRHLTHGAAKPGLPFAGKYRIIDFPLSNCVNSGIRHIGVLTQYKSNNLNFHLQRGWGHLRWEYGEFVGLLPAQQQVGDSWYKGTADAVYQNLCFLRQQGCKRVLILGGDHVYKMDYAQILNQHKRTHADVTIASVMVPLKRARDFGVMTADKEGWIQKFTEKPTSPQPCVENISMAQASMGIYVFEFDVLEALLLSDAEDPHSRHDFGYDLIPKAIEHYKVQCHTFNDENSGVQSYWKDVGSLDEYYQANIDLVSIDPELNLYDETWPIYTYQDQLPGAKFVFDEHHRRGHALDSVVSAGCIISGARVEKSFLFSRARVEEGSLVKASLLLPGARVGKDCHIERAILAEGCQVPDNTQIGLDPEEDRRRFYISENGIVLVMPEMLEKSDPS